MKSAVQASTHRCDCGLSAPVLRVTAYEFDYRYACGCAGTIAWAHESPPPVYVAASVQSQMFRPLEALA